MDRKDGRLESRTNGAMLADARMKGIGLKELAFVGYPVTDFAKARKFYGEILGLKETMTFEHEGELGWLEYDLAGQTLGLAKASDQWQPNANGGGACLEVEDLDRAVTHLKECGVRIVWASRIIRSAVWR